MTTIASGGSAQITLGDGGMVAIASNGGFWFYTVQVVAGSTITHHFGPRPARTVLGPYAEGATVSITSTSAELFYQSSNEGSRASTVAAGASSTLTLPANGSLFVASNGGFGSVSGQIQPNRTVNDVFGPAPFRKVYQGGQSDSSLTVASSTATINCDIYDPAGATIVGGVAVGSPGAVGTMYEGYTLSYGDDFTTLDILGPANPRGKYWTTRTAGPGARTQDSALAVMYDTDPLMTGHNDSNRGVPVGFSNMSQSGSVVSLNARKASGSTETNNVYPGRANLASMLATFGSIVWHADAQGSGDVIVECRLRFSANGTNPLGWHPTFWTFEAAPVESFNTDELDWEGTSQRITIGRNVKVSGVNTTYAATSVGGPQGPTHDGQFHTVSMVINKTGVQYISDQGTNWTSPWNGNTLDSPAGVFLTSHVYNAAFDGETFSQASWDARPAGSTMDIDWIRVWRRTGKAHYKPLQSVSDQTVAYGASTVLTLPSAAALWGDGSVTEYLQAIYNEENEPGVDHLTMYSQFPTGVTYNAGTRQLTVNITSGNTGRINFVMYAWKAGATCEPLRFAVNVGPRLIVAAQQFTNGAAVSFDLYAQADCGVLVTNGVTRTKTISVSGLAGTGLSYNDSTGLLTGTYTGASATAQVTITNSLGQSVTSPLSISAAASFAYQSWTGDNVAWYDASDSSNASATALTNKRGGGSNLTGAGAARTYNAGAINGLNVISFARDTSNPARFSAGATTDSICTAFSGNDKAYVAICVFRPTDANTAFIWACSGSSDGVNAKQIALVRRSGSASDIRRTLSAGGTANVAFTNATGQPSGSVEIVAVKFTGTTVTIWRNSTTPFVAGAAQDVNTFGTDILFRIGAAYDATGLATTACTFDFCEMLVQFGATRSDADIQQAITDLASKWGATLT